MGSGDLSSDPHACQVRTLSAKLPLQPRTDTEKQDCSSRHKMSTYHPPSALCCDIRNSPDWPQTQDLPESASQLLRLQVCTLTLNLFFLQILLLPVLIHLFVGAFADHNACAHVKTEDGFPESHLLLPWGSRDANSGCQTWWKYVSSLNCLADHWFSSLCNLGVKVNFKKNNYNR